jgi:hypothetical protein
LAVAAEAALLLHTQEVLVALAVFLLDTYR